MAVEDVAIWSQNTPTITTLPPTSTPTPTPFSDPPSPTPTPIMITNQPPTPTPTSIPKLSVLSLSPASQTLTVGQTFTTQVRVNTNGQTVNGVQSDITYPSNLSVSSITGGDFDVEAQKTFANGTIHLAYGATVPKSGNLLVATITFKALTAGTASVIFTNSSVVSNITNTNVLKSSTNASYSILAPTPTPTATPTPTIPPTPTPVPFKTGDINHDNKIDVQDLSYLLSHWNSSDTLSDLNHDGKVNTFDLSILLTNWGK
jgi:hypothetical protein